MEIYHKLYLVGLFVETPCWRLNLADKSEILEINCWIEHLDLDASMASLHGAYNILTLMTSFV